MMRKVNEEQMQKLFEYKQMVKQRQLELSNQISSILVHINEIKNKSDKKQIKDHVADQMKKLGLLEEKYKTQTQITYALSAIMDGQNITQLEQQMLNDDEVLGADVNLRKYRDNFNQKVDEKKVANLDESALSKVDNNNVSTTKQNKATDVKNYPPGTEPKRGRLEGFFVPEFPGDDEAESPQKWLEGLNPKK